MNYADIDWMHKKEHGWWNAVIMKKNKKRFALMNFHRIVDSSTSGVNSCKAQHERAIGRVKRARQIRKHSCKHEQSTLKV